MFIISIKTFNYNYGRHEVTYKRLYWFLWHAKNFMEAATNFLNYFKASHESESKGRLHNFRNFKNDSGSTATEGLSFL